MPKGNNVIPNAHFHKHWQRRIKTWFDQPGRKQRRYQARKKKSGDNNPLAPKTILRPVVRCPSVRYNSKLRLGRGFTLQELKCAKLSKIDAKVLGIAVDFRRTNKSTEGMDLNIDRLKRYRDGLIPFPPKNVANLKKVPKVEAMPVTDELKSFEVYKHLRRVRADKRLKGKREKKALQTAEAAEGGLGAARR